MTVSVPIGLPVQGAVPNAPEPAPEAWNPAVRALATPAAALGVVLIGWVAGSLDGHDTWRHAVWLAGLLLTGGVVVTRTLRQALRGHFATDVVASLSIVGAFVLGEPLAGLVVVIMQTGGEALERFAEGRASTAVRALVAAAPRTAHKLSGADVTDLAVELVEPGDLLLVRPGEFVPTDGVIVSGRSHIDTARLTGEPVPRRAEPGATVMSGGVNQEGALTIRATARSSNSQYARIVELVRTAQASKSPLQRLADRYAVWFTPATIVLCAITWLATQDARRVLAVLVIATPCPLILATPIAIIGGINRAARRQIIVRHGAALEQLGSVRVAVFDKTGTLTIGQPRVSNIVTASDVPARELLRLAGSVEQSSGHLLARSVVEHATKRGVALSAATDVVESPGRGVEGRVDGRAVVVGSRAFVAERQPSSTAGFARLGDGVGSLRAHVAVDGEAAGVIDYADALRAGVRVVLGELRQLGITRTVLVSGDHLPSARAAGAAAGIGEVHGDLLPEGKVRLIRELVERGERVLMVGDGTNDAPALSTATVGIALAAHGGGITAEAADVVLLADDLGRVAEAMRISRRTLRIAHQSIWAGLSLSAIGMLAAALGYIPPAVGALLQEAIDVAVIVNALRAR